MKNSKHLRLLLSGATACAVWFAGCIEHPDTVVSGPDDPGQGSGIFDYATKADIPLKVDYAFRGNKALFEVYAENPLVVEQGVVRKKEGVRALFKAYTDNDCTYSGLIDLPTAVDKVYLYSESYGVPVCVEAAVTANGISFDWKAYLTQLRKEGGSAAAQGVSGTRAGADNPYNIAVLGGWNNWGLPYYIEGERHGDNVMAYPADVPAGLMNRIQTVLLPGVDNAQYAKPTAVVNINVTKAARLNLVFLAEMASWRNAIGYYYYDTQHPPLTQAEFDALPKYIAFPNCSVCDPFGAGVGDVIAGSQGYYVAPLDAGVHMKMRYYRNGRATDVFPEGTTVGWFILPDGFKVTDGKGSLDMSGAQRPIRYSNNEFNADGARYLVSLYDKVSGKTILGFEDSGDGDYKDVLFYVDADPQDAVYDPDRPTTDPDQHYPDVVGDPVEGTLAFEDLWPSQGDYDLNDVVVAYSTTFTTDKENRLVGIRDVFTPLHSGGQLRSAFGYQLDLPLAAIRNIRIENGSSTAQMAAGLEKEQDKPVVMLFDDIGEALVRGPVTVTIELDGSVSSGQKTRSSLYNPFICVSDKGFVSGAVRKEIHLTNYAPTSLADPYPFGRNDDKSSVDEKGHPVGPYYYVTSDSHPFAIDLPVTDYRIPDEMRTIDEFYPDFPKWVASKGLKYREWYLKPQRAADER